MATVVTFTGTDFVQKMIEQALPRKKHWVLNHLDPFFEIQRLEMVNDPDVIVVADILKNGLAWQRVLSNIRPDLKARTILFRVGLDETIEPYETDEPIFASVHGRRKPEDEKSLQFALSKILGE